MLFSPKQQSLIVITFLVVGFLFVAQIGRHLLAQDATFGPQLFLVEGTDLAAIPNLTRHSELASPLPRVVASGTMEQSTVWTAAGARVLLLDADTSGKSYYLVEAQSEPDRARQLAAAHGQILFDGGYELVISLAAQDELHLLETLPAQGIAVARVGAQRVPINAPAVQTAPPRTVAETNPLIENLLTQITTEKLESKIRQLSGEDAVTLPDKTTNLVTRYTFSPRIADAEVYLFEQLKSLGLNPSYAPWTCCSPGNQYSGRNVVADIVGSENPERIWVIGGHFDTNSEIPYISAPGADDNASGVASTMLIADILKEYNFRDTVRIVYFSGEEQGQWGSLVYANSLRQAGVDIRGYINLDMIGYDGNGDRVVELHTGSESSNPRSNQLALDFIDASNRYGQGLVFERKTTSASRFSDHRAFWDNNYAAFLVIENFFTDAIPRDRSPYYHTSNDRIGSVDLDYVARIARTALASIAEQAGIVDPSVTPTPTGTPTQTGTPTATTTASPTQTPTATATGMPGGCLDLVLNGGFEETSSPVWAFSGAFPGVIVDSPVQTGVHAARAGVPDTVNNQLSYSTIYQQITIPSWPSAVLLSYWEQPNGNGDNFDAREVRLLNPVTLATVATLDRQIGAGNGQWRQRTFDLTAYAGRTLVLYFNVYNNGSGGRLWSFLDDVAVLACDNATPTPTATATATQEAQDSYLPYILNQPSPTPTLTATPTSTATATETATATATETATATLEPTDPSTPTSTPTTTPTSTATTAPSG
ncbi:M28 family peptidase [bacterium]|nr:M28 family peptidase [bacterium]